MTVDYTDNLGGVIMMGSEMMGSGSFGSFGMMGGYIGLLFNIAVLIGIVLLIVWMVQKFSQSSSPNGFQNIDKNSSSARDILDVKYVQGELDRKQYQAILNDIS